MANKPVRPMKKNLKATTKCAILILLY